MSNDLDIQFLLQNIKSVSKHVLDRAFGSGKPTYPIDLSRIAKSFNVPIYEERLESNLAGCFIAEKGSSAIVVNASDPTVRKRFTIAHELGHFISYKLQEKTGSIYDERGNLASLGVDPEEVFANKFAAELLMPEDLFKQQIIFYENEPDKIARLAENFNVSRQAVGFREKTVMS